MFLEWDYIIYVIIFLWLISFGLFFYLTFFIKRQKKNKDYNNKKTGVPVDLKKENGIPVDQKIVDSEKFNDFNFNSLKLFKATISNNDTLVIPELGDIKYISIADFFFSVQKYINNLVFSWVYSIWESDLFKIHKSIRSLSLNNIKKTLDEINESNWFKKDWVDITNSLLNKIIIGSVGSDLYCIYNEKKSLEYDEKVNSIKIALRKKINNDLLSPEESNLLDEYDLSKEITKELKSVCKNLNFTLLNVDIKNKELSFLFDKNDIFSNKILKMVKFLEKEENRKNINKVKFYI